MERHLGLIRKILEYAERRSSGAFSPAPECLQYSLEAVHYHIGLCGEAGLLIVESISGAEEPYTRYAIGNLTWNGYEALDELKKTN